MQGVIDRRILVNYRVDPEVLQDLLPRPFRAHVVNGYGIAGFCLIRLRELRPQGMPAAWGVTTENAAHRIAVQWDAPTGTCSGVFIPRRDTPSRLTVLLGGRLFPGVHHRSQFSVAEDPDRLRVGFISLDESAHASVDASPCAGLPADSAFGSLEAATNFFESSPLGYSPSERPGSFEGLELRCEEWQMNPLHIAHASSSFFDSEPSSIGTSQLDSAFLMTDIRATWHGGAPLIGDSEPTRDASPSGRVSVRTRRVRRAWASTHWRTQ